MAQGGSTRDTVTSPRLQCALSQLQLWSTALIIHAFSLQNKSRIHVFCTQAFGAKYKLYDKSRTQLKPHANSPANKDAYAHQTSTQH